MKLQYYQAYLKTAKFQIMEQIFTKSHKEAYMDHYAWVETNTTEVLPLFSWELLCTSVVMMHEWTHLGSLRVDRNIKDRGTASVSESQFNQVHNRGIASICESQFTQVLNIEGLPLFVMIVCYFVKCKNNKPELNMQKT